LKFQRVLRPQSYCVAPPVEAVGKKMWRIFSGCHGNKAGTERELTKDGSGDGQMALASVRLHGALVILNDVF
jgi:hypothetical protein